jgi:hypothetical protein
MLDKVSLQTSRTWQNWPELSSELSVEVVQAEATWKEY